LFLRKGWAQFAQWDLGKALIHQFRHLNKVEQKLSCNSSKSETAGPIMDEGVAQSLFDYPTKTYNRLQSHS
jgi:hypothetical protein